MNYLKLGLLNFLLISLTILLTACGSLIKFDDFKLGEGESAFAFEANGEVKTTKDGDDHNVQGEFDVEVENSGEANLTFNANKDNDSASIEAEMTITRANNNDEEQGRESNCTACQPNREPSDSDSDTGTYTDVAGVPVDSESDSDPESYGVEGADNTDEPQEDRNGRDKKDQNSSEISVSTLDFYADGSKISKLEYDTDNNIIKVAFSKSAFEERIMNNLEINISSKDHGYELLELNHNVHKSSLELNIYGSNKNTVFSESYNDITMIADVQYANYDLDAEIEVIIVVNLANGGSKLIAIGFEDNWLLTQSISPDIKR